MMRKYYRERYSVVQQLVFRNMRYRFAPVEPIESKNIHRSAFLVQICVTSKLTRMRIMASMLHFANRKTLFRIIKLSIAIDILEINCNNSSQSDEPVYD